jgi:hypothetical protein
LPIPAWGNAPGNEDNVVENAESVGENCQSTASLPNTFGVARIYDCIPGALPQAGVGERLRRQTRIDAKFWDQIELIQISL